MMAIKIENYVTINILSMKYMGMCPQGMVTVSNNGHCIRVINGGKGQRASIDKGQINGAIWIWGSLGL